MWDDWLIWGKGGHGRVIAEAISQGGGTVAGWVDRDRARDPEFSEEVILAAALTGQLPTGVGRLALGIGDNRERAGIARDIPDAMVPPVIAISAHLSPQALIGPGTVLLTRTVVHPAAVIGRGVIINTGAIVEHDCVVHDWAHLSPGVILSGGVAIEEGAWIGAGAVVLPGVAVGRWATIGAGAVVTRDVPDHATFVGIPAGPIDRRTG